MAYSTLLSLEKTIDLALDHDWFSISPHGKKQIISLEKCVVSFRAFLEDFPEKAKNLEARITDVAIEAEDIIEWFSWKQIRNSYRYIKWFQTLEGIVLEFRLQKVRDEMDSIAEEVVDIKNNIIIKDDQLDESVGGSSSSQVADTEEIITIGFDQDLKEIKEKLCGWAPQLQVLPIFGMGGIGKTTLARNAYNDQLIKEHFQVRAWVTISQDYSKEKILFDLLSSMKQFNPDWRKESTTEKSQRCSSEMALKVHKILALRRFLIVMDDIWSREVLDDVKHLFPNGNRGSRIMLTTRLAEIANYANSSTLSHEMRLMDPDQSWNLLWQKVFVHQDRVPPEVVSTGKEIARSCGGLPLAIVVIAGVLSSASKNLTSWYDVARYIRSSLAAEDGKIKKILSLSYDHLPHHLRPCFLYMGGFPEDHEIKVTDIIRLWIAESFVESVVSKTFEDTAEKYLNDLVDRSLVVVTKRKPNGKIKCCSLHDMVREMCIKLSEEEKFLGRCTYTRGLVLSNQRRLSVSEPNLFSLRDIDKSHVRTIIYFPILLHSLSFKGFRLLRVLDVVRVVDKIPCQFFELFHLRYLAFRYHQPIPRTISNLQSLQTLIINEYDFKDLPYEIWNMPQLRHLITTSHLLAETNADTCALENLQTLRVKNLTCSISTLELIPNLTKLWLSYSSGSGDLLFHNLVHFTRLEKLHLALGYRWSSNGKPNLVVPSSLRKLTLNGWGKREPCLDIVGPFPNLEVLKLKRFNFKERVWRTSDEDFPQLKFLLIEKSDIMQWETESSHFPRLKTLHIHSCMDLSEIPECIEEIPTLELIELKFCTDSLADSTKHIQEEAEEYGDGAFEVHCVGCRPIEKLLPPPKQPEPPKPIVSEKKLRRKQGGQRVGAYLRRRYA